MKYLALIPFLVLLTGCAAQSGGGDRIVAAATPDQQNALLGRVKSLQGRWEKVEPDGQAELGTVYQVTSNGSAVREVMFPGAAHEMTNLYHMDGKDLVMTHYCAVGNQPRMRATAMSGNTIHFVFDSVTNHTSKSQTCMREMSLEIKDQDHIVQHWKSYDGDRLAHQTSFELRRLK